MKGAATGLACLVLLGLVPGARAQTRVVPVRIPVSVARLPNAPVGDESAPPQEIGTDPEAGAPSSAGAPTSFEGALQAPLATSAVVGIEADVAGLRFDGVLPPDSSGEAGPSHYVEMTNGLHGSRVSIFDKTTGARLKTFVLDELARSASVRTPCDHGFTDPVPVYDQLAGRWLLTEDASLRSKTACVYVSSSSNPLTSTWSLYTFTFNVFPDYPKYAVWPVAYFMGFNNGGVNAPVVALDRASMLLGQPAAPPVVDHAPALSGFRFQILSPVDLEGSTSPPSGAGGIFVRHDDDEVHSSTPDPLHDFVQVFEMVPNFTNGTDTLTETDVFVAEFSSRLCPGSLGCIPQAGTRRRLDALRQPVMHRPVYRASGAGQVVAGAFTVAIGGSQHAGVRWFELGRPSATTSGGWTVTDEGTVAVTGSDRWLPSIDVNGTGDVALAYNVSSPSGLPQIRLAGRLAGDPPGTMGAEVVAVRSRGAQTFSNRWGDYAETSVDPTDDHTFWYVGEYLDARGLWRTRILRFHLS